MPHCVIECPAELQETVNFSDMVNVVHASANASQLFQAKDIKVRVMTSQEHLVGGKQAPYVHVTAHILDGRDTDQKKQLSGAILAALVDLLPDLETITVEVCDIHRASYAKRAYLER